MSSRWRITRTKLLKLQRLLQRVCLPCLRQLSWTPELTILQELETRQITLIELVQSLGEYINDEDVNIRARAISYLVAVLSYLPPKFLSRQQIQVLNQFLCDRIQDGGAIEGLSHLQALDRFTTDMAQSVVRA